MIVYHYTSKDAHNQIVSGGEFMPSFFSKALDAAYGEGWYFTDLEPSKSNEELYLLWDQPMPQRVRYYLVFEIDSTLLQHTRPHVYRLPLDRIQEAVINLNSVYKIENKVVISFKRRGSRGYS